MQLHNNLPQPFVLAQSRSFEAAESELHQPGKSEPIAPNGNLRSPELLSMVILGTFVLLYVILFKLTFDPKQMHTAFSTTAKIPCKQCQFYLPNRYLQCAVHPSRALTFNAIDCSDYCSKQNDFNHL